MATEYGERLLKAMAYAGINQKELVKRTGIKQSTVSSAINRSKGSSDSPAYASACGVSALWLATGQGRMESSLWLPGQKPDIESDLFREYDAHQTKAPADDGGQPIDLLSSLKYLTDYMQGLDPSDRKAAMVQIASLAEEPERCAKVAASIQAMAATGFAKTGQKAA